MPRLRVELILRAGVYSVPDIRRSKKRVTADHLYLEVTNRCNLDCTHCIVRSRADNVKDPGFDVLTTLLSGFREHGGRYVTISGGEPGLRTDLPELISEVANLGLSVTLYTNGFAVTDSVLDNLLGAGGRLAISLDGPNADIHETMKGAGTYVQALGKLEKAVTHLGGRGIILSCVLSRPLLPHVDQLWAFVQSRGIWGLYLNLFEPLQRSVRDHRAPSSSELVDPVLLLLDIAEELKTIRILFSESHDLITASHVFSGRTENIVLGRTVKVQADGWAFPGPFFYHPRFRLGRPLEHGWTSVLNSDRYIELREQAKSRVQHVAQCKQCFWSYRCGGGSLALTWAFHQRWTDPCPLCELYRATLDRAARRRISSETLAHS